MLNKYRKQIDKVDKRLVKLIEKRLDIAKKIGEYKRVHNMEIYAPEREKMVLDKVVFSTKNPQYKKCTTEFYEKMLQISKEIQEK